MKSLIAILTVFLAQQSFACIEYASQVKICPGETVYKGDSYSSGATVIGVNQFKNTVTVRSNSEGNSNTENVRDLYITRGCIGLVCVGNVVYKGPSYSKGATVLAINSHKGTVIVKSNYAGNLNVEYSQGFDLVKGCLNGICVGDTVYKGSTYTSGATVLAINPHQGTVTVKANHDGNLNVEYPQGVDLVKGCLNGICVGDTVYKGSTYSSGATVLAINPHQGTVTVKSNAFGNLNAEDPRNLDVTNMCADYGQDYRQQSMSLP